MSAGKGFLFDNAHRAAKKKKHFSHLCTLVMTKIELGTPGF